MGERCLWTAVLLQAIEDCAGYGVGKRARPRAQYFARLWFKSANRDVGSFLWICDELELEPSSVRRRIASIDFDQVVDLLSA
jgi:hypothetical protein